MLNLLLKRLECLHPKLIDLSLARIEELLVKLGNPHLRLPPVVHVAGTNGKGSTLAFLRAMLEAAGYRVHVYTSPHLIKFNERIRLAGDLVSDKMLSETLREIETINAGAPITFFEITTTAAFLLFARNPADIVLLETGLGGRLDATNVIPNPAVTAITRISVDHTEFLGDTLEKITAEKAGIMKPGVPCIVAPQYDNTVAKTLSGHANKIDAPLCMYGKDWMLNAELSSLSSNATRDRFELANANETEIYPLPNLVGAHQLENAATALVILEKLGAFNVPHAARAQGLQTAAWPARLEKIKNSRLLPVNSNCELWCDGAHNDSGAEVLAAQLRQWKKYNPNKQNILIVGMLKHKNADVFFQHLMPACDTIYALDGLDDKFFTPDALLAHVKTDHEKVKGTVMLSPDDFAELALSYPNSRLIICGSLYLRELVSGLD